MMQPDLHRKQALSGMFRSMAECTADQIAHMEATYASGDQVDLHKEMMRVTLDIVSRCMFSANVMHGPRDKLGPEAVDVAVNYAFDRLQNPFSPPTGWPTPRNRRFHQVMDGDRRDDVQRHRGAPRGGRPDGGRRTTCSTCCSRPRTRTPARG